MNKFKLDVRDKGRMSELDDYISKLAARVLEELRRRGFEIDFHFLWKFEQWETDRVDWEEVPAGAEVKINLGVFTVDGKRYKIPLARLVRDFSKYEIEAEVYDAEEAVSEMEEL